MSDQPDHNPQSNSAYHFPGTLTGSPYPAYGQPPIPPQVAARDKQRFQRWGLLIGIFIVLALLAVSCSILTTGGKKKAVVTATIVMSPSVTPQPSGFYATVTPAPDATVTPTLMPGQPSPTPVLIYVTARPAPTLRPLPTYTLPPGQPTYTPQPTYTTPPAPTATGTPRPTQVLHDPDGNDAAASGGGLYQTTIVAGTINVIERSNVMQNASLTWNLPNIRAATVTAYYCYSPSVGDCGSATPDSTDLVFSSSPDGSAWTPVPYLRTGGSTMNAYWRSVTWQMSVPANTQYLQVYFPDASSGTYGPAVGEVDITYQP